MLLQYRSLRVDASAGTQGGLNRKRPLLEERPSLIQRVARLPAGRSRRGLVTVRAVDRLVSTRLKRNHRFLAALRARGGEHLPLRAIVTTTTAVRATATVGTAAPLVGASLGATRWATLWILVSTAGVKLLVLGAKCEPVAALRASQGSFCVGHVFHLFSSGMGELEDYKCNQRSQPNQAITILTIGNLPENVKYAASRRYAS